MDFEVPCDENIVKAEQAKMHNYQDMAGHIRDIYQAEAHVATLVVGVFGNISRKISALQDVLGDT